MSPTENDAQWINNLLVTPAKEAVRKLAEAAKTALDRRGACFETRPMGTPQHEGSH
jgi:hypothetical protein